MGPYFDLDADVDCIEGIDLNTQLPIYIILTRPTFSELYGFELGLDYGSNLILIGQEFANSQALNVGSGDDFIVGYGLDYNGYGRNYPEIYKIIDPVH